MKHSWPIEYRGHSNENRKDLQYRTILCGDIFRNHLKPATRKDAAVWFLLARICSWQRPTSHSPAYRQIQPHSPDLAASDFQLFWFFRSLIVDVTSDQMRIGGGAWRSGEQPKRVLQRKAVGMQNLVETTKTIVTVLGRYISLFL